MSEPLEELVTESIKAVFTIAERREAYLKQQIERIKAGGTIDMQCVMSTPERIGLGLCSGKIPDDRAHRGLHTCSAECQADKRRLERWEKSKGNCRLCGHNLSKKERDRIAQERAAK